MQAFVGGGDLKPLVFVLIFEFLFPMILDLFIHYLVFMFPLHRALLHLLVFVLQIFIHFLDEEISFLFFCFELHVFARIDIKRPEQLDVTL